MITLKISDKIEDVEACLDRELFDRIAEDGHAFTEHGANLPYIPGEMYFLIMSDRKPIGFWLLYPANSTTLNIHCNIRQEHRQHGKQAAKLIGEWFVYQCPENYQKLNAEIPTIYPDVYHFTKSWMKDEGINRLSILKQGKLVDQWRLGVTRAELSKKLG